MVCSFRMIPNAIKGSESCSLIYEGSTEPANVIGKKIHIKIMEIDKDGKNDLLAEFESAIGKGGSFNYGKFLPDRTTRTDSENHILPSPEIINDSTGNSLPVPLEFKPAYFSLKLWGIQTPFIILMKGDKGEIEDSVFEIGISILMDGAEIFNSFKMPVLVDCNNLLGENCINAALFFKRNHDSLLNSRGVGTHFGNKYPYFEQMNGSADYSADPNFSDTIYKKFKSDKTKYQLKTTSCIDYVKESMSLGFSKTGFGKDWEKIWKKVTKGRGDLLAAALVEYGWEAYYYNPDVFHPVDDGPPNTEESKLATEHTYSYMVAQKSKIYYGVKLKGTITNYFPSSITNQLSVRNVKQFFRKPSSETVQKNIDSQILKKPFGLIIARGGKHTAMFSQSKVFEVHWDISPWLDSPCLFSVCDFVREWPWNSGIIVFPGSRN